MSFLSQRLVAKSISYLVAALFVIAMVSGAALAQTETGNINGKVLDPNGALVPNASVEVKSVDTGATTTTTSSGDGTYTVSNLKPGFYDVTATATGYAPFTQRVQVTVGSNTPVETRLSITAGQASVTVVAEGGIAVNTQNQEVSNVISETQLRQLPSLTRNPYDFVALSGNVAQDPGGSTARGVGVSINGQRAASTNILLDGGENVNTFTAQVGQTVPLDAVQEYRVITNNFSAQYGRATGGIVDVATKSGTNDFHGTGYEFNRISKLASNGFDNNAHGIDRPHFTRNQFGYSIGGPIKKNKLFFFSSTEWTRVRSTEVKIVVVPTSQLIAASDPNTRAFFNAFPLAHPINGQIFSVSTVCPGSNCGAFTALGANFPAFGESRFSVPQNVGAGDPQDTYQTVNRIDYNLSSKTQIYGRFAYDHRLFFPGVVNFSPYTGFDTGERDRNQNWNLTINHNFTSKFTSTTKFIFNRLFQLQPLGAAPVGPTLYITGGAFTSLPNTNGEFLAFPGYSEFTPGNAIPFGGPQNVGQINEDMSYTRGRHQLNFGGSIVYIQDNRAFGAYEEATEQLGSNTRAGLNNFVNGQLRLFQAAVFPQGQLPGGTLQLPVGPPDFTRSNRYRDFDLYFNDAIKYTPRLTVNLGLRYEYYGVQHNKNPNKDSNFFFGPGATLQERIRNGQVLTSPNSPVGGLYAPDKDNFGPHIGFAWDVLGDGKTSIRGGYARAFERNFGNVTFNVIQNPPNYAVVSLLAVKGGDITPGQLPVTLSNAGPLAGSGITKVLPVSSLRYLRQDLDVAYSDLFSLGIERELSPGTVVSLTYNGSRGNRLYAIENLNRTGFGTFYLGSEVSFPPAIAAQRAAAGQSTTTTRLNGQFGNINGRDNNGFSRYNALVASIESSNFRRLHLRGLQFTARYTYSVAKDNLSSTFSESTNNQNLGLLDPFDPHLDYGYADFDVRHRFSASFNYDVPWGRTGSGWARKILGGWTLAGTFVARTGTPFTLYDCTNAITVCLRAEANGPISFTGPKNPAADPTQANIFNYINVTGLTPGVFTDVSGGTEVGPFPADMTKRNAFRGPGFWNLDGGIYKTFRFTERYSLQLRGELYNVFNHANLYVIGSSADLSLGNPVVQGCRGCGTTVNGGTNVASDRRNVQLALKFIF